VAVGTEDIAAGTGARTGTRLIHGLLDDAVRDTPGSTAVRDATGAWTYRTLDEMSHAFAHWLRDHGVERGARLVVQAESTRELVAMFYGASRCGVVFVPLNPDMKRFHLSSVLANAEPALIIAAGPAPRGLTGAPVHHPESVWRQVEDIARYEPSRVRAEVGDDELAVLIYTSGSTAAPKAVMCPHAQVTFASSAIQRTLGYRPDDVVFCRFPLSWDYGLYKVLLCCLGRSELVLAGRESDLVLLSRMRECGATVVPIVPSLATMIAALAARDTEPPPPVRLVTNTGAALPAPTIAALRSAFPGVRVVRQFGQTECKRITIMPPERDTERPDSVGLPLPGTEVLILDESGRVLPPGETGEIVAVGPHVMPGYWRATEQSARAFRRDRVTGALRLHTGDYGCLDAGGYLYFEGRRDDMFKRKGIRMSTVEIEAAAMDVPGVRTAAAVPPSGTRDLALFVESDLPESVLKKELVARLEPAKVPARCVVVAELPLTPHGKSARAALVEMLDGADR
jgi:acyl-CoA synthetase (AMP-forming)/AMP-acid ligase II